MRSPFRRREDFLATKGFWVALNLEIPALTQEEPMGGMPPSEPIQISLNIIHTDRKDES